MSHFLLGFEEDNVPYDDDAMSHSVLIETDDGENAYKVLELVKTVKEDLDGRFDTAFGDPDNDESDGLTPEQALEKEIIEPITYHFLTEHWIKDDAETFSWDDEGWHEKIDTILDYLSTSDYVRKTYGFTFTVDKAEHFEIAIN